MSGAFSWRMTHSEPLTCSVSGVFALSPCRRVVGWGASACRACTVCTCCRARGKALWTGSRPASGPAPTPYLCVENTHPKLWLPVLKKWRGKKLFFNWFGFSWVFFFTSTLELWEDESSFKLVADHLQVGFNTTDETWPLYIYKPIHLFIQLLFIYLCKSVFCQLVLTVLWSFSKSRFNWVCESKD